VIGRILDIFGGKKDTPKVSKQERLESATCVLLLEVANADEGFSPEERDRVIAALCTRFSLTPEQAGELIAAAKARRAQSYDLWKFTNEINEICSVEEKKEIIAEVWRVIYADGVLSAHEDYIAHKLGRLLNLTHPDLIAAKLQVLEDQRED
jgi:uncharacterized tellurite resistance protein B-like protein